MDGTKVIGMARFLLGLIVGAAAAVWIGRSRYREELKLDRRLAEMQKRTEAVLDESRHILRETRGELTAAMEAARESVQEKAERLRTVATESEGVTPAEEKAPKPRVPSPSEVE